MDLKLKVAILRSGKRQWKIAQEAGISETKLSKHLCGHSPLREEELHRLFTVLKIGVEQEPVTAGEGQ